jgi:hypothetical protein
LKVITLRAAIGAPTPVFGLRPMRSFFWRTANCQNREGSHLPRSRVRR